MEKCETVSGSASGGRSKLKAPIIVTEPHLDGPTRVFQVDSEHGEFRPIDSDGELYLVTDESGRQVPGPVFALAQRYAAVVDSAIPAFELAVLAATDDEVLGRLRQHVEAPHGQDEDSEDPPCQGQRKP